MLEEIKTRIEGKKGPPQLHAALNCPEAQPDVARGGRKRRSTTYFCFFFYCPECCFALSALGAHYSALFVNGAFNGDFGSGARKRKQSTVIGDVSMSHCPLFSSSVPVRNGFRCPPISMFIASFPHLDPLKRAALPAGRNWIKKGIWRDFDRGQTEQKRGRKDVLFSSNGSLFKSSFRLYSVRLTAAILKQPPRGSTGGLHEVK